MSILMAIIYTWGPVILALVVLALVAPKLADWLDKEKR